MQKRNELTMNRIFDSAEVLFSEKDFYDVKIEEIAKKAEVGKGTIYTYFKSKEELLFKCLVRNIEDNRRTLLEILSANKDFESALHIIFYVTFNFFQKKGPLIRQFMNMGPKLKLSDADFKFLRENFGQGLDTMSALFQKGIDQGLMVDFLSARQMAIVFQKMFDFNVIFNFYGEPELDVEASYNLFKNTFLRTGVNNEKV